MKKYLLLTVTMFLLSLTVSAQTKKVAILEPICRDGSVNLFYKNIVRGEMEIVVASLKEFQAYDRTAFDKIMEEQNFQRSGAVSDSDIKKLGVMAGVDYIVVPEVSAFDGYLSVLAKILDVETGQYNKAENEIIKMEPPTVKQACSSMAQQLFNNAGMAQTTKIVTPYQNPKVELQLDDGRYVGEVSNGKPHGYGIVYFKEDDANGCVSYEGNWKNGAREGHGIMIWKDGDKYDGNYENGVRSGQGTYYFANGNRYEGNWVKNKRNGQGILYYADGNRYEGNWNNSKISGHGTFYWVDGDKYVGNYENDLRNGLGTYYFANGNIYEGHWKDNKRNGQGIFYWANGNKYDGNWVEDDKSGQGTFYWADGDKYVGNYENDKRNGYGIYYYNNGDKYDGGWTDNKKDGQGTYYWENGDADSGTYIMDKRDGDWKRTTADKKKQKAKYKNGEIVKDWH